VNEDTLLHAVRIPAVARGLAEADPVAHPEVLPRDDAPGGIESMPDAGGPRDAARPRRAPEVGGAGSEAEGAVRPRDRRPPGEAAPPGTPS
jgi:hypothetical protein